MKNDVYDHHAAIYFLLQDKYNRAKLSLNREQLLNSSSGGRQQQQQQQKQLQQQHQHPLQPQQVQQRHTCRVPDTGVPESIAEESPTAATSEPVGPAQTAQMPPPPLPLQPPPPPPAPLPERMPLPPARPAPPTTLWETEEDSSPSSSDPPTDLLQQVKNS